MYLVLHLLMLVSCQETASTSNNEEARAERRANFIKATKALEEKEPVVQPLVTGLYAAKGEETVERTFRRDALYDIPELPPKGVDILAQLGINLVNEMPEETTLITDDMVRAAADVSYSRLGIADEALRGWTLFVRLTGNGTNSTSFNEKKKFIVVEIDPPMFPFVAPHELTHVLSGRVVQENWLPGIMNEFLATAAEIYQPPGAEMVPFTYEILNRPILGTAKNLNGENDRIHATGAPLDGLRYELLRAAGKKIGDEAYRSLATEIYKAAVVKGSPMTMDDLQPVFAKAGIGDCVLFTRTSEPGVYVDLVIAKDHSPMILTKYIDGVGQESMPQAPFSVAWRKNGKTISQYEAAATPIFADNGSIPYAADMDQYVVKVGTLTYTYNIEGDQATGYVAPNEIQKSQ